MTNSKAEWFNYMRALQKFIENGIMKTLLPLIPFFHGLFEAPLHICMSVYDLVLHLPMCVHRQIHWLGKKMLYWLVLPGGWGLGHLHYEVSRWCTRDWSSNMLLLHLRSLVQGHKPVMGDLHLSRLNFVIAYGIRGRMGSSVSYCWGVLSVYMDRWITL